MAELRLSKLYKFPNVNYSNLTGYLHTKINDKSLLKYFSKKLYIYERDEFYN